MLGYWMDGGVGGLYLDRTFTQELRDLKGVLTGKDTLEEIRDLAKSKFSYFKNNKIRFKSWFRSLVGIGSDMSSSKEFRDFFIDLVEKIIEPMTRASLVSFEVDDLFTFLLNSFTMLQTVPNYVTTQYLTTWTRFIEGVRACTVHLFGRFA
eukprot:TRINITY_DN5098_c0_g1_i3.p1 TRINITY_DN5098_c0_g1~~TRINITY_DN5098_c0_g1_i3.p1  ORF type:complete len:151 (+),score=55.02 TRINITY_DN5098_c0_g1_i3:130-582(+)